MLAQEGPRSPGGEDVGSGGGRGGEEEEQANNQTQSVTAPAKTRQYLEQTAFETVSTILAKI